MKLIDMTGKTVGRLKVVRLLGSSGQKKIWLCRCSCGRSKSATTNDLTSGHAKSCGCILKELRASGTLNKTHGHSCFGRVSGTYGSWRGMVCRCSNKNTKAWWSYGHVGIRVCKRWLKFENFLKDMGERPAGTSIDRINIYGDYKPSNCRWATASQQVSNRRTTRRITVLEHAPRAKAMTPNWTRDWK